MSPLASLRSRIFLASALLTVLSVVVAIYLISSRVNLEAENAVQRDLIATAALVDELRTTRVENFTMMARLIADAPKLKAAVDTDDPPTVQDVSDDYQERLHSHLLLVTNRAGRPLASVGPPHGAHLDQAIEPATREALAGRESFKILAAPDGMLQVATVPIAIGIERPEILGTISVGFLLDDALASQLKAVTGSDIAFGMDGAVLAGTLTRDQWPLLGTLLQASRPQTITLAEEEFSVLARPLAAPASSIGEAAPAALVLRSRTDQIRILRDINTELAVTAVLGVLLATLLSFAVARTITSPLTAITAVMREVAATGDLTRKIALRSGRWHDEDARLLATTFNTLTESIARSQREMAQKERLSSLGRLSTVIAHEVRNPLMIIKSALHSLRPPAPSHIALREAVEDIDGEVIRLNRLVNEVLDFARPIRFELAATDLNALCRDSAAAAQVTPGPVVELSLDPSVPPIATDAERLRLALVNLIVNARQAVEARESAVAETVGDRRVGGALTSTADEGSVSLTTRASDSRVTIVITDAGNGIDPSDLARVFDPYFTTKRGGTGLGLPIAKNIVEGLGGTLTVLSRATHGTELRIDLPVSCPADASSAN